jgi:hypothetical protein
MGCPLRSRLHLKLQFWLPWSLWPCVWSLYQFYIAITWASFVHIQNVDVLGVSFSFQLITVRSMKLTVVSPRTIFSPKLGKTYLWRLSVSAGWRSGWWSLLYVSLRWCFSHLSGRKIDSWLLILSIIVNQAISSLRVAICFSTAPSLREFCGVINTRCYGTYGVILV